MFGILRHKTLHAIVLSTLLRQLPRTMATASSVQLTRDEWPEYYRSGIDQESSRLASKLLQENHERHHIFFNKDGFHNVSNTQQKVVRLARCSSHRSAPYVGEASLCLLYRGRVQGEMTALWGHEALSFSCNKVDMLTLDLS